MSYDVSLKCMHCDNDLGYDGNYTYNLSNLFQWAIGGRGLDTLDGLYGAVAYQILVVAVAKCEDNLPSLSRFDPPNKWGDSVSAVAFLREIRDACKVNPNGVVRIT